MKSKVLISFVSAIAILIGVGYWYIFVEGAPQLDPPQEEADTGLTFQLETFNSQAMGAVRTYGVILPPGYQRNFQKRYPVIFLGVAEMVTV